MKTMLFIAANLPWFVATNFVTLNYVVW